MMRPSLRTKQERRLLIEVEGAAEGVQEAGEEGVGDLGDGEGGVGEGVRKYGGDRGRIGPENEPGRRPSKYGIRSETKTVRTALERAMPVRHLEGRNGLYLCELQICSSDHFTGRF